MSRTYLQKLPPGVKGLVREDENGDPVFILNKNLSHEENIETYLHECQHIAGNDLDRDLDVDERESEICFKS